MADKQATVYVRNPIQVIDLGSSMNETHNDREENDLDYAMHYVWDRITATVANGRKTDTVGVVGFRTDDTDNPLQDDDSYANITVLSPLGQFLMPQIRSLQEHIQCSKTEAGDGISAVVVGIDMIEKYCRKLKYIRNIVLVTNGRGPFDTEELSEIEDQVKEVGINLTILGIDFDDPGYGFKEEDKNEDKRKHETALKIFCENCNGNFGTLAEAIEELERPRTKKTRPVASYKGTLTIGNEELFPGSSLSIDVERYPRTMVAKPVSATSFVSSQRNDHHNDDGEPSNTANGMHKVRNARTYQVDDEEAPGGKVDVEREEMAKGYMYGRTIVPISASDQEIVVFETDPSLDVIGFIPKKGFERYIGMSNTNIVIASRTNDRAIYALSSFIHALFELDSLAVARLVTKKDKPPLMLLLAPSIDPATEYECLVDVQLPFAEDVRHYKFAPLDTVKTITGKVLDKHRFIPTEELQEAMNEFVDSMDISEHETSEDGTKSDYAPCEDLFSPILHRINQVIRWRAIHPEGSALPKVYPILTQYSTPPSSVLDEAKEDIARLIKVANLYKIPPRAKGKRKARDQVKPLSGLDVDRLLEGDENDKSKRMKVDPNNAIPSFIQAVEMLDNGEESGFKKLLTQFGNVIEDQIRHSLADSSYNQAVECLSRARENSIQLEYADLYNDFMKELKQKIVTGKLGGDRKDFLSYLRKAKVGLITSEHAPERSNVSPEDGRKFYFSTN